MELEGIWSLFGGVSVILVGLSAWLGRVWERRIAARDTARLQKENELLKSDLRFYGEHNERYDKTQFEHYSNLWESLSILKSTADDLWNEASSENLGRFVDTLGSAIEGAESSKVFLDKEHFEELQKLFHTFNKYHYGKAHLLDLRSNMEGFDRPKKMLAGKVIKENKRFKNEYSELLDKVSESFREKLGIRETSRLFRA